MAKTERRLAMPAEQVLNINHKRFLGCAIAVVACSSFLTSCHGLDGGKPPTVPTTWTITFSPGNAAQRYKVDFDIPASQGGCKYATTNPPPDPKNLVVCLADIVKWKGDSPGGKHQLVVYVPDPILNDVSGHTAVSFIGYDNQPTNPGRVSQAAVPGSIHEWFVALFDKGNTKSDCDEPRIKIGG
jgi:hypothetical protein